VTRIRRPSAQTAAILRALAGDPDRWRYGYDLCTELGLQAGSMYPILIRLADRGLLETSWETEHVTGRPARHLYRLTAAGREYAAAEAQAATEAAARDWAAAPGPVRRMVPGAAPGSATGAPAKGPVQPRWEGA
jgi:PadR family transcriptional regulator, regulatory protein PadR